MTKTLPRMRALAGASNPRVLLVDDDELFLRALRRTLAPSCDVTMVGDGDEAIAAGLGRFDVIVSDLEMPGLDGEGLKRELDRRGLHVPVIFISASPELPTRARRADVFGWLAKPFEPEELRRLVNAAAVGVPHVTQVASQAARRPAHR